MDLPCRGHFLTNVFVVALCDRCISGQPEIYAYRTSLLDYPPPSLNRSARLEGAHGLGRILINIEDLVHARKREYLIIIRSEVA